MPQPWAPSEVVLIKVEQEPKAQTCSLQGIPAVHDCGMHYLPFFSPALSTQLCRRALPTQYFCQENVRGDRRTLHRLTDAGPLVEFVIACGAEIDVLASVGKKEYNRRRLTPGKRVYLAVAP
jgi:hypothetical protein